RSTRRFVNIARPKDFVHSDTMFATSSPLRLGIHNALAGRESGYFPRLGFAAGSFDDGSHASPRLYVCIGWSESRRCGSGKSAQQSKLSVADALVAFADRFL